MGPLALLRRLPRTVQFLVAGTFVNRFGSFILPFLTLVLSRDFHLSETRIGFLLGAYGAGTIVAMLGGGFLVDRLGRRRTLLVSLIGSGLLALAMGFATSAAAFVPLLLAFSFFADLYRPASAAVIADLLPSEDRAVGFAAMRLAINLGFGCGVAIGGLLADLDWRWLFWGDGLTTLGFGAMVYVLVAETRGHAPTPAARGAAPSPWRDAVFVQLIAASFLFCLALAMEFLVLPLTVTRSAGYPARVYGLLTATNGFVIALFELSLTHWLRRFRRLRVAALGVVFTAVGVGATGLVMHWAWFLACVLLFTAGEILTMPQHAAFLADWSPPEQRGRYLGLSTASWGLGATIAPVLFLPLHARVSEAVFWGLLGAAVAPAGLLLLRLDRAADQPDRLRGRSAAAGEIA